MIAGRPFEGDTVLFDGPVAAANQLFKKSARWWPVHIETVSIWASEHEPARANVSAMSGCDEDIDSLRSWSHDVLPRQPSHMVKFTELLVTGYDGNNAVLAVNLMPGCASTVVLGVNDDGQESVEAASNHATPLFSSFVQALEGLLADRNEPIPGRGATCRYA